MRWRIPLADPEVLPKPDVKGVAGFDLVPPFQLRHLDFHDPGPQDPLRVSLFLGVDRFDRTAHDVRSTCQLFLAQQGNFTSGCCQECSGTNSNEAKYSGDSLHLIAPTRWCILSARCVTNDVHRSLELL